MSYITAERIRALFHYEPETGVFTRKVATSNSTKVGDIAGSLDRRGYRCIMVDGKIHKAHRLAWLYVYGSWPLMGLDHRNRVRDDNRIDNLREATPTQNCQNTSARTDNRSGYRGVHWHAANAVWVAQIRHNKKSVYLGSFGTPEAAYSAYLDAAARLHTHNAVVGGA